LEPYVPSGALGKQLFSKNEKKKQEKPKETLSEAIQGIAAVLVSGLFIITFIIQAFEIPSRSMEKTLLVGDHVFVDRLTAAPKSGYLGPLMPYRPIRRGEVAVFISPHEPDLHLVKRIVGVPGDRLHLQDGVLYVNGVKQNEPYVYHAPDRPPDSYADNFPSENPWGRAVPEWPIILQSHMQNGEVVIPPHSYFAMGDSRQNSFDSRFWGFVPEENIIGRPLFIYWSFDTPENQYQKTSWGDRIQFIFHVIFHFFDQTRWGRMFHPVR
jgi:signal peptidase I